MDQTVKKVALYRIAIGWAMLFSLNALGTAILGAIVNVDWAKLNTQAKSIIFITTFVNWSGTMMAFFSQAAKRLEEGQLPMNGGNGIKAPGDTQIITKEQIEKGKV
jgi:hypothetical protein